MQNVGNLVAGAAALAAVQYAVAALQVPLVAVCGHSGCGAMRGLLDAGCGSPAGLPRGPLGHWLSAGLPSLHAFRGGHPVGEAAVADGRSEIDALAMTNVAVQLDVLRGHGTAAELMGLFLDIPTARVLVLDRPGGRFRPLPEQAGSRVARAAER